MTMQNVNAERHLATKAHRLSVQVRMELDSPIYSTYVLYGFESVTSNRAAFICRKYEQEVDVGVGLKGNHRAAIGQGYYVDDIYLRQLCLYSYLITACPPRGVPTKAPFTTQAWI